MWFPLFLVMIGSGAMQLLNTLFFKYPLPQKGALRFLKLFVVAFLLGYIYMTVDYIIYGHHNYNEDDWKDIGGDLLFSTLLFLFISFWFFLLVTVGHYHFVFKKLQDTYKYYITSVMYMGFMFVLYHMCWYQFVFQQQEQDLKRYVCMGLFFSMLGIPMAFLQRRLFRSELRE